MKKIFLLVVLFALIAFLGYENYWKYFDEKKLAYDYLEPASQKTVKSWKWADVDEYTAEYTMEIWDKESEQFIDINGMETLVVSFKTTDDGTLGPIDVYLDMKTTKVIGIGVRK